MPETLDLGPLQMSRQGQRCYFTLSVPDDIGLELPPDLEAQLAARLARAVPPGPGLAVVLDLQDVPAISSRQLGVMLALHKCLSACSARLPVTHASERVRRLLAVTKTDQFFELE
jgi:anti-anti-sigma factor